MQLIERSIPGHPELPWRAEIPVDNQGRYSLRKLYAPQCLNRASLNGDLLLHKYAFAFRFLDDDEFHEELKALSAAPGVREYSDYKRLAVQAAVKAINDACKQHSAQLTLLKNRRMLSMTGGQSLVWNRTAVTRLFLGLGSKGIWETSVRCHPHWGFPQLDGSGLKGITRAWAVLSWMVIASNGSVVPRGGANTLGSVWPGCPGPLSGVDLLEALRVIFGSGHASGWKGMDRQGWIVFHDAWPDQISNRDCYVAEVINPHYGEYYSGGRPPSDSLSPVPSPHIAVRHGLTFQFLITSHPLFNPAKLNPPLPGVARDWLAVARCLLDQALDEIGFGGRRSSGYGFFRASGSPAVSSSSSKSAGSPPQWAPSAQLRVWTLQRFLFKKGERQQLKQLLERDEEARNWLREEWRIPVAGLKRKDREEVIEWLKKIGII